MSEPSEVFDLDTWTKSNALIQQLLPAKSLVELLDQLAKLWDHWSRSQAVAICVAIPQSSQVWCFFLPEHHQPRLWKKHLSVPLESMTCFQIWEQMVASDDLTEWQNLSRAEILFPTENFSGVLLLGQPEKTFDETLQVQQLTSLSCCLIEHGLWLDELQEQFSQRLTAAKLESLAEFAAGAGHEINNPLATISGRVQLLLKKESDPQNRQALQTMGGQVYRIRDMIGDVMLFARPPEPEPTIINLTEVIHQVGAELSEQLKVKHCQLEFQLIDQIPIWADQVQLKIVLRSLIQNSLEASENGKLIQVTAIACQKKGSAWALFSVTDQGRGLSELEQEHLFDPFFSGRQAGRGLGFGLSKCWRIVGNHQGEIYLKSTDQQSTTLEVLWPASEIAY